MRKYRGKGDKRDIRFLGKFTRGSEKKDGEGLRNIMQEAQKRLRRWKKRGKQKRLCR
jgi:hypothetical protein